MKYAVLLSIIIWIFICVVFLTPPARAAMEHEEIVARLAAGLSLKPPGLERRPARRHRRSPVHGRR